ncbi:hypothetical protein JHK84_050518 [Glycine max]|nr:hypothetical protein JHK84_050518 [Glycine max]
MAEREREVNIVLSIEVGLCLRWCIQDIGKGGGFMKVYHGNLHFLFNTAHQRFSQDNTGRVIGEKNVTLEDVMVLEGFAIARDPVFTPFHS